MRERESKEAHSFQSKDLTAALKEAWLLFSSFTSGQGLERGKIKAKKVHSPTNVTASFTAILS